LKNVFYTPTARTKLKSISLYLKKNFGEGVSQKVLREMTERIQDLAIYEELGGKVLELFGVESEYRYIFIAHNYVFYKVDEDAVRIIDIYNEREDFMFQLFGIHSLTDESVDE